MYVKKFPRCARQFVKNFLRKLIFRGRCVRKSRISKEETVQRLQGCKTFQGAMREKIANYKGGNSVCRGPKLFRCVRKLLLVILKCLKEGNSVCRGTKVLRSHFDSKQIGKALPFCFALCCFSKKRESLLFSNECFSSKRFTNFKSDEAKRQSFAFLLLRVKMITSKETHFARGRHWVFVF